MSIKAVFFDMGGTVETYWYTPELRLRATSGLQDCLRAGGIHLELNDEQLLEVVSTGLKRYHHWSVQTMEELPSSRVWNEYIFTDYSYDRAALDKISEDLMLYIETSFYHREMRPEMPEVLESIKQMGLKIGLISNVNSRGQVPANLTKYNLREYFDPIVLSSEYGRRKPDPAIFHHAARLANVPTSKCVYVGDRIIRDILGARKAGFAFAVQIQHDFDHGEDDSGAVPDAVIKNMSELLDILQDQVNRPDPENPGLVRAILFDAGDILYFRPNRGKAFEAFLKDLGLDSENNHVAEKKALVWRAYRGQINQDQFREAVVRLYGVMQPDQIERGKQLLMEQDNDVQFFEGVPETLQTLKDRGYLLGIVTDTANSISTKLSWFESGGFGHVWDSIISSKEIGVRKPDPLIFRAALQQLDLSADQVVFIGHKPSELQGARAAGMKTIAFNYDEGAEADCYIEKFTDLLTEPILKWNERISG